MTGNDVKVELRNGLTRCFAIIHAQIETLGRRRQRRLQMPLRPLHQFQQSRFLHCLEFPESRQRATRNNQRVP